MEDKEQLGMCVFVMDSESINYVLYYIAYWRRKYAFYSIEIRYEIYVSEFGFTLIIFI